ncbi:MAG: hypothetical protein IKO99_08230 [Bacteroidales bacterium]|nr:hypothetical protein [Bacteroidales bacterium]
MKKTFLKFLPLTAAVLFATSCSKDENNDEKNIENQPKVEKVVIPFSVKVNTSNSISKIAYTQSGDNVSQFNVNFEEKDAAAGSAITMNITGDDIENTTLTLTQDGSDFKFVGDVTLAEGKTEDDFKNGNISISGSFGTAGTTTVTSTTSLADVMSNCSHQYTTTFASNATTIELIDNYAYLEVSCASTQTKFNLTIGGSAQDYTPSTTNNKIWIAVPNGTSVTGNMIKSMTVVGGKVYRANRTKEVDLGPGFSVLWTTCNLGASKPGEYGNYYAYGETTGYALGSGHNFSSISYTGQENPLSSEHDAATAVLGEGYRMPTSGDNSEQSALANCSRTWETQDGNAGYKFYTDYGSVFLPAAGYYEGAVRKSGGSRGYYWSSTPYGESDAICLYFYSGRAGVNANYRNLGQSVRAVRCMN